MVKDTIKAIIMYNKKLINTTSLSDSKSYLVKWQHISTISLSMLNSIAQVFMRINICERIFANILLIKFIAILQKCDIH